MMKVKFIAILLALPIVQAVGQGITRLPDGDYSGVGPDEVIVTGSRIDITTTNDANEPVHIEDEYVLKESSGIPFLQLNHSPRRFVVLWSKEFLFLNEIGGDIKMECDKSMGKQIEFLDSAKSYASNGFLTEGTVSYAPANLSLRKGIWGNPFVPSREVGWRKSTLRLTWYTGFGLKTFIVVSNGFVSADQPYLYRANARAKGISIYLDGANAAQKFELEDTPNPQILPLPIGFKEATIRVDTVYHGERWDDLCLNFILAGLGALK